MNSNNICQEAYCIKKFHEPFDWNEFLHKQVFSAKEIQKAFLLSERQTTCACGNQCSKIPRNDETGSPKDLKLRNLENEFYCAIGAMQDAIVNKKGVIYTNLLNKNRIKAIEILKKIEVRSDELLMNIEQNK